MELLLFFVLGNNKLISFPWWTIEFWNIRFGEIVIDVLKSNSLFISVIWENNQQIK